MSLNKYDVLQMTTELLEKHKGIAINKNFHNSFWKVSVEDCGINTLGYCNTATNILVISSRLIKFGSEDIITKVIKHEVAHALAGIEVSNTGRRIMHGKSFKRFCDILGTPGTATLKLDYVTFAKIQGMKK